MFGRLRPRKNKPLFPVSIIKRAVRFLSGFYSIGIKSVKSEGPRSQLYGLYISWLHNLSCVCCGLRACMRARVEAASFWSFIWPLVGRAPGRLVGHRIVDWPIRRAGEKGKAPSRGGGRRGGHGGTAIYPHFSAFYPTKRASPHFTVFSPFRPVYCS